jgi:putative heme iron utilization protein
MNWKERLLDRVRDELLRQPGASVRDLARKFSTPEAMILEALRDGTVRKVKPGLRDGVLDELRTWGTVRVRVHNDWAEAELDLEASSLSLADGQIVFAGGGSRIQAASAAVDAVYFVSRGRGGAVQFFNRRGRFIFDVEPLGKDPKFFQQAADRLCGQP